MKYLILDADKGDQLEKVYYMAMILSDSEETDRLYETWQANPTENYWYDAFIKYCNKENVLISAVLNVCHAPFGAYVLTNWNSRHLELVPWLFSDKFDKNALDKTLFNDEPSETELRNLQRTLMLTAEFVAWMKTREKENEPPVMIDEDDTFDVAFFGQSELPGTQSAIDTMVTSLSVSMAEKGNSVIAYNNVGLSEGGGKRTWNRIYINPLRTVSSSLYGLRAAMITQYKKADVYHFHSVESCSWLRFVNRRRGRVIVTIPELLPEKPKTLKRLHTEKLIARYADEVIVLTDAAKDYYYNNYKCPSTLIPIGLDKQIEITDRLINAKYGINKKEYLLFRGPMTKEKGVDLLIDAFRKANINRKLVLVTTIDWRNPFCREIADKISNDNRIIIADNVSERELDELYNNCAAFVLPSLKETLPIFLLEAMVSRTPCLVSDLPENIEVGKGLVNTFETGSVTDLTEKLKTILDATPLEAKALNKWDTWSDTASWILMLYRTVTLKQKKPQKRFKK